MYKPVYNFLYQLPFSAFLLIERSSRFCDFIVGSPFSVCLRSKIGCDIAQFFETRKCRIKRRLFHNILLFGYLLNLSGYLVPIRILLEKQG